MLRVGLVLRKRPRMPLSENHDSPEGPETPRRGLNQSHYRFGLLLLGVYCLFLVCRAWLIHKGSSVPLPVWTLQNAYRILEWIGILIFTGFYDVAKCVPVGLFAALAAGGRGRPRSGVLVYPAVLAFNVLLVVLLKTIESGQLWHTVDRTGLILCSLGCLLGIWVGRAWLRGSKARLWLIPKMAFAMVVIVLLAGGILWFSVEAQPLEFDAAQVTSAEKRRLVNLIRSKSPKYLAEDHVQTLALTEHDLDVLLSWGLSLGSPHHKAKISLALDSVSLLASIEVASGAGQTQYLNLTVAGDVNVEGKKLRVQVDHLRLGAAEAPPWLLKMLSPVVAEIINQGRLFHPFLEATREVKIEPNLLSVTYGHVDLPPGFREDLFGAEGVNEAVLSSTRAQVENLLAVVGQSPDTKPGFCTCVEAVFSLARERSRTRDPRAENRAAIFALGMLLGHPRIEEFLGPVHTVHNHPVAQRLLSHVDLRGRSDWTRHFWVSAVMAILSDEVISNAAGLLKEELDADQGGSGFSFADLLADRAGTTLAMHAIRDEATARALQNRLASDCRLDDIFPDAADLPEGISDPELQSRYGGVGGRQYNLIIADIERRLAACSAYQ